MQTANLASQTTEKFILGLLIDSRDSRERILPVIEHADFSSTAHRKLFHAIHALTGSGIDVDRITVADYLTKSGELGEVGGFSALVSLSEDQPPLPNTDSYLRIIKSYRALRRLHDVSRDLETQVLTQASPHEIVRDTIGKLEGIERDNGQLDNVPVLSEILDGLPEGYHTLLNPRSGKTMIPTGLTDLDRMIGGLEMGSLFLVGAHTSAGKSALAMTILRNICSEGIPAACFSVEMTSLNLLERLAAMEARVDLGKFRAGRCDAYEMDSLKRATQNIYSLPLYIDECPGIGMPALIAKSHRLIREKGVRVIVVDYLQRLTGEARRKSSRESNTHQLLTDITEGLKQLAMKQDVCVFGLSQLNRSSSHRRGDGRPGLSDLRESGSLEECADQVGLIFRESLVKPDREDLKGFGEIILAKNRNGPTGVVKLRFRESCATFEDL